MAAYDNPSPSILTGKVAKEEVGPTASCNWVLVKGTIKSLGESDDEIALASFERLDVANTNQLEAGAEAGFEFIAGVPE